MRISTPLYGICSESFTINAKAVRVIALNDLYILAEQTDMRPCMLIKTGTLLYSSGDLEERNLTLIIRKLNSVNLDKNISLLVCRVNGCWSLRCRSCFIVALTCARLG